MILSKEQLSEVMTEEEQRREIERIQSAPDGLVLYTSYVSDQKSANICETLLSLAGCTYHESVWLSRAKVKWVKGSLRFNFAVA